MIRFAAAVFSFTLFFAVPAMACMYDAAKAEENMKKAVFVGSVKITKVEYPISMTLPSRPRVTYEVVEAKKRAEGFNDTIIVIEPAVLNSCDFAGPWKVGDVVEEAFFKEGDKMQPSNINMRVLLDSAGTPANEGR